MARARNAYFMIRKTKPRIYSTEMRSKDINKNKKKKGMASSNNVKRFDNKSEQTFQTNRQINHQ